MSPNGAATNLHLYDHKNHLFLTGFYLPTAYASIPITRGALHQTRAVPDDDGVGQALTEMAKERAATLLRGSGQWSDDAGLQTWVFNASPRRTGPLDDWFRGAIPNGRYRVLVHRTPRRYAGRALPAIWDEVYDELYATGSPAFRGYTAEPRALRSGVTVLAEGLGAYLRGAEAVMTWADGLGHPYALIV
jgi:hypothetical protein